MRIGVYGGTFNPPHTGHIQAAKDASAQLELDLLIVVPAGTPPHKELPAGSPPPEMRLQMTRDAFAGIARTVVSDIETSCPDVHYTVDTVAAIKKEHPGDTVYLLVGADMYLSLETWKDSADLLRSVTPAVFSRNDDDNARIAAYSQALKERCGVRTEIVRNSVVDISSSELREMLPKRAGAGYIIDAIYSYIIKHRLYGAKPDWVWLRSKAYDMLEPGRIPHVAGCETESVSLAGRWAADSDDSREAAILHDITKKLSVNEHMKIIENSVFHDNIGDIPRSDEEKLFHSITGMILARDMFGVSDDVAEAIRWHTTGKAGMSDLEKIIYLADYIEPSRELEGIEELRDISYKDLNAAMILGLHMSILDMETRGIVPNTVTYDALKDLKEKL